MKKAPHLCPCGSDLPYANCCQPWHGGQAAPTPEALMRSRYSAYVLGLLDYLLATWHPSTAPGDLELDAVKWLGLEVKAAAAQGVLLAPGVLFSAQQRASTMLRLPVSMVDDPASMAVLQRCVAAGASRPGR